MLIEIYHKKSYPLLYVIHGVRFPAVYAFLVYTYLAQTSLSVGIEWKPWHEGYTIARYKTSSNLLRHIIRGLSKNLSPIQLRIQSLVSM